MSGTVASIIAGSLVVAGISHVFAVPGESFLPVLDALRDMPVRLVTCRHEAAAAHMADAAARLSGRPGVVMVSRGPGAAHAAVGLHTAQQDSTALLLLVGQVGEDVIGREAFQEVNYQHLFGDIAKAVIHLAEPARAAEQMGWALSLAQSGRPGPVVVVLPDDRLALPAPGSAIAPTRPAEPDALPADALATLDALLVAAERPLLLLGGPGLHHDRPHHAAVVAERLGLPVITSWRRKDHFDNSHPHYAGELGLGANPALIAAVQQCDLLIAVGARLTENTTQGYRLFDAPWAARHLVHICADPQALGRVWQGRLHIQAATDAALNSLARLPPRARPDWVAGRHRELQAWMEPTAVQAGVNPAAVIRHLSGRLPLDAILCNGAGNFAAWLHRFHSHRQPHTQLAPTSGAMGYGLPAGIAAALLHPERQVVVVAGDGDLLMVAGELATIAHEGAKLLLLVLDNGQYGTIRMHQARDYPGRPSGVRLASPDFAALARSFGLHGETVRTTAEFPAALERSLGRAALIHLLQDPDEIAPGRRLDPGQ